MFCSKCGTKNAEGAKFCSKCGAKLGEAETPAPTEGAAKPETESSTGLSTNVAGLLCYVGVWVTGIIFLVLEKKSKFVKFHAWQSIMVFGVLNVALIIFNAILGAIAVVTLSLGLATFATIMGWLIGVLMLVLWIVLMLFAYQGKMWKVPIAGNWAEKQANK